MSLVGRPSAHNWVQYHAETGRLRRERASGTSGPRSTRPGGAKSTGSRSRARPRSTCWRRRTAASLPEIKFFNLGELTIAGHKVRALHHGMSGVPGLELFGPWDEHGGRRAAIVEAGSDHGLRQVGSRVYATNTLESGGSPARFRRSSRARAQGVPRVAPGRRVRGHGLARRQLLRRRHRRLLPTPHDLGYWPFVRFDHDFVGRDALEEMADEPERKKVTLAWNGDDVASAMGSLFERAKRPSTSTSRSRTTRPGRTTSCCTRRDRRRLDVLGLQLQRALAALARLVDVDVPSGPSSSCVGRGDGGSTKPSSSGTRRRRSEPS